MAQVVRWMPEAECTSHGEDLAAIVAERAKLLERNPEAVFLWMGKTCGLAVGGDAADVLGIAGDLARSGADGSAVFARRDAEAVARRFLREGRRVAIVERTRRDHHIGRPGERDCSVETVRTRLLGPAVPDGEEGTPDPDGPGGTAA
ncbi:MAG TPA: hypothetical protein PKE29_13370 [Phycisphaerales bacterium]|nr:hypothetical protein [Phycisphaerales bacterium]